MLFLQFQVRTTLTVSLIFNIKQLMILSDDFAFLVALATYLFHLILYQKLHQEHGYLKFVYIYRGK